MEKENSMACSLLMLTRSRGSLRAAPDWSESLSVMTEGQKKKYCSLMLILNEFFLMFCTFLCNSGLSGNFSVRDSTSSLFSN